MSLTWNMPWSTPRKSISPAPDRTQKETQSQAIGRSKGGMTTKTLAFTEALGKLVRFVLLPGQRDDTVGVPRLTDSVSFGAMIADKRFESNAMGANGTDGSFAVII